MRAVKKNIIPLNKGEEIINSYKAHLKWGNCYTLFHRITDYK